MRVERAITGIVWLSFSATSLAGGPDYSHLSDAELRSALIWIAALLAGFTLIGIAAWWRYRRDYQPATGRFTPVQAMLSVLFFLGLVLAFAWSQLT